MVLLSARAHAAAAAIACCCLIFAAAAAEPPRADESVQVCVVGAGPAGVAAATALARKGKSVVLLERDDAAGGQTTPAYTDPATGFRLHMGAIMLTPPDYPIVMEYARRVGLGVEARAHE